ncbi:MAG TPA: hypothetical protein VKM55_19335 [Candidatus Lokiarchaeia archaeon]|nr:hypothetical protein [Candidatus Lokiarchaeia archaeon]
MKIYIVYDSKFGNNKQVAEAIAALFNDGNEVHVHHAKTVKPKDAIDADMLIFGGPLRAGCISFTIKGWVTKFSKLQKTRHAKVNKVAAWCTHGKNTPETPPKFSWNNIAPKWKKLLDRVSTEKTMPDIQPIVVDGMQGPLETGWQDIIATFVERIKSL